MKSFAVLSLAAAAAAMPAPDHVITVLATCTDAPATETVTVYGNGNGNGGYQGNGGNGGYQGNGGNGQYGQYSQEPYTVTVTKTVNTDGSDYTQTWTSAGQTYTGVAPPENTYTNVPPPDSTYTGGETVPTTHTVAVGAFPIPSSTGKTFEFRPNQIKANVGDKVKFQMLAAAHSVTQSTFLEPCVNAGLFDSGKMNDGQSANTNLIPNKANATDIFVDFEVTSIDKPLWFYCSQTMGGSHCGKGMVFGINPKSDQQMLDFIGKAKAQNGTIATSASGVAQPTHGPVTVGKTVARAMMW